jgi:hypothetical protein
MAASNLIPPRLRLLYTNPSPGVWPPSAHKPHKRGRRSKFLNFVVQQPELVGSEIQFDFSMQIPSAPSRTAVIFIVLLSFSYRQTASLKQILVNGFVLRSASFGYVKMCRLVYFFLKELV